MTTAHSFTTVTDRSAVDLVSYMVKVTCQKPLKLNRNQYRITMAQITFVVSACTNQCKSYISSDHLTKSSPLYVCTE